MSAREFNCDITAVCYIPDYFHNRDASAVVEGVIAQSLPPKQIIVLCGTNLRFDLPSFPNCRIDLIAGDFVDRNQAWNRGVAAASQDLVALVNPEAKLAADCLERLAETLVRNARNGVVAVSAAPHPREHLSFSERLRLKSEVSFGLRQNELIGCLGKTGFCTPVDYLDELGLEPFDVDAPPFGVTLYQRDALCKHPFPESYDLTGGDGLVFHGLSLTRHQRMLLEPRALAGRGVVAPVEQRIVSAYWQHEYFARRTRWQILSFAQACMGAAFIELLCGSANRVGGFFSALQSLGEALWHWIRREKLPTSFRPMRHDPVEPDFNGSPE